MKREEAAERVNQVLQNLLQLDRSIGWDEDLAELGIDSMKSIEMIIALETEFDILYEDDEMLLQYFTTIRLILDRLEAKQIINE